MLRTLMTSHRLRIALMALVLSGCGLLGANDETRVSPFANDGTVQQPANTVSTPNEAAAAPAVPGQATVETPAAAPAAPAASGRYVVVRGDSLWKIAQRFLGSGSRYWDLVEANKERYPSLLKNPDLIHPGWEFVIPGVDASSDARTAGVTGATGATGSTGSTGTTGNVPAVNPPAPGARGGKALLGWLQQTGLTGERLRQAWAVGMKESGGNPSAFNGNASTGDKSYGLFQINMIGSLGPARLRQYGLSSADELFDPVVNCRVMMRLSNNGTNWGPWGIGPNSYKRTQSSPGYERYYNAYPPQ